MNFSEYQIEAMKTANPKNNQQDKVMYGILGLFGESGEVAEMLKKSLRDGIELNRENLVKELGDVLWYMAYICNTFDIDMQDAADGNIKKLRARHGEKYSGVGNRTGDGA